METVVRLRNNFIIFDQRLDRDLYLSTYLQRLQPISPHGFSPCPFTRVSIIDSSFLRLRLLGECRSISSLCLPS